MLVSDVLKSCSYGRVAEAAVASIGGDFATKVKSRAVAEGLSVGDFTAQNVRAFARVASERDWRGVMDDMRGADLALLSGLQAVVTRMMKSESASGLGG